MYKEKMYNGDLKKLETTTQNLLTKFQYLFNKGLTTASSGASWISPECLQDMKRPMPLPSAKKLSKKEIKQYQNTWEMMNCPEYQLLLDKVRENIKIIDEEKEWHASDKVCWSGETNWDSKLIKVLEDRKCDRIVDRKKEIFILE